MMCLGRPVSACTPPPLTHKAAIRILTVVPVEEEAVALLLLLLLLALLPLKPLKQGCATPPGSSPAPAESGGGGRGVYCTLYEPLFVSLTVKSQGICRVVSTSPCASRAVVCIVKGGGAG